MTTKNHVVLHDSLKHMLGTFGPAYIFFFASLNGIYCLIFLYLVFVSSFVFDACLHGHLYTLCEGIKSS